MDIKDGVQIAGLKIEMRVALIIAEGVWKRHGQPNGVTITAGLDGVHSAGSLHYYGYAFDCRTRYWDRATQTEVFAELQTELKKVNHRYGAKLESNHIHVQYKPEGMMVI